MNFLESLEMQGGRDALSGFGDPFGNIGGFGGFSGFERDQISSFFGGHDPFDDGPFSDFGRMFGGFGRMFGPGFSGSVTSPGMFGPGFLGSAGIPGTMFGSGFPGFSSGGPGTMFRSGFPGSAGIPGTMAGSGFPGSAGGPGAMFGSGFLGSEGCPFSNPHVPGFLANEPSQLHRSRGPVIEELHSEDEDEQENGKDIKNKPGKHGRSSKEPIVEDPDDEATEKKGKHVPTRNEVNQRHQLFSQPQSHSFTFQSSTVSYGGANGEYYTSSTTRRTGSDGIMFEECKEADTSTGKAMHRASRAIHEKGHSVTRKLESDGHVDTMQTLHNLNEDQLSGFDEAWKGAAGKYLPSLGEGYGSQVATGLGDVSPHRTSKVGRRLPSTSNSNSGGLGSGSRAIGRRGGNHELISSRRGSVFRKQLRRN